MGIFEGHLLASDIDGTLLDNGYLPQENIDAIHFFLKEGGAFSLATGRTIGAIGSILEQLGEISPCIMANGSIIYDHTAHLPLHFETLPDSAREMAQKLYDFSPDIGIEIHSLDRVIILRRTAQVEDHDGYEDLKNEDMTFEKAMKLPWNEVLYLFDTEEQRTAAGEFVAKFDCDCRFVNTSAIIYGSKRFFLQQNPTAANKALALKRLCELLNIKKGCCYAIGDYYNDLPMLEAADISAAPQGSPEDIKAVCNVVVKDTKYGAVADFIEYLKTSVNAE